jgi:hypothetical protein
MKPYERFLVRSTTLREILDTYLKLRQIFQELEFTDEDLETPPIYTQDMMFLFQKFQGLQRSLINQINDYGLKMTVDEFFDYLKPRMDKINELTPMKDGDTKRRNSRDEDFE